MKTIVIYILILTSVASTWAQVQPTATENYIHSITYKKAYLESQLGSATNDDKIETVQYFDGLGRPLQSIGVRQGGKTSSGGDADLVTPFVYDVYGRQVREYLPLPVGDNNGRYINSATTDVQTYYHGAFNDDFPTLNVSSSNPFSTRELEASPLNRVLKQAAPGEAWRLGGNHEIEFDYQTNSASEVKKYQATIALVNGVYVPSLSLEGDYAAGELYKTITLDENHSSGTDHTTEEFTDKRGRVILKRTYNAGAHDTYYVYDHFGNLTYVIPPKAVDGLDASFFATVEEEESTATVANQATLTVEATKLVTLKDGFHAQSGSTFTARINTAPTVLQDKLDGLSYQYVYDHRNRLIEKKIPGKGWEYIVYDKLDRPALTQDANQRAKSPDEWLFTKYDALGRVAYTGIFKSNDSRNQLQGQFNAKSSATDNYEEKVSSGTGFGGTYYTNSDYPTAITTTDVLTVNYYDDYSFDTDGLNLPSSNAYAHAVLNYNNTNKKDTKGLPTGSKVRTLGDTDWTTTVNGYDEHRRVIWTGMQNDYLSTTDYVESKLDDITGWILETKTRHIKSSSTLTTIEKFGYDHSGKLTSHTHKVNSQAEQRIAVNEYDDIGQLVRKKVGGAASSSNELQVVDYEYNIRGWLKQINNPNALGSMDLFGFKINYNTADHSGSPLYNGNIAETEWKTANDNVLRWYRYTYDALNRITTGISSDGKFDLGSTSIPITYDKNGNIERLYRKGHRVASPTISNSSHYGVMDNLDYNYETNSNRLQSVQELSGGHSTYGFKNGSTASTEYTYDANGNMLTDANKGITATVYNHLNLPISVTLSGGTISYMYDATGIKLKKTTGGSVTDYAGNYVYQAGSLQFFNHAEGYVYKDGSTYKYVYQYKDHLGNIRLSYEDGNGNGAVNQSEIVEENNYYPFGLKHQGYNNATSSLGNSVAKRWKYNGKELEEGHGLDWYEMDVRQYNPAIARWTSIDPVVHHSMSPYNAFDNNPAYWADPSGANSVQDLAYAMFTNSGAGATTFTNNGNGTFSRTERDENPEDGSETDCCGKLKKALSDFADQTYGKILFDTDVTGELWYGEDNFTYHIQGDNEFYRIRRNSYERVDELPASNQAIQIMLPQKMAAKGGTMLMGAKASVKQTMVYLSKQGGKVIYVGITNNFARRAAQHLRGPNKLKIDPIHDSLQSLSRNDARAVEQVLIEYFGLGGKRGQTGQLLNRINSISENNKRYGAALKKGKQLLEAAGFTF
ncbi:DUF6443 domain-containing protein [Flagellimonas sp. 2504JD4-2]